jgi:hypothetical protein
MIHTNFITPPDFIETILIIDATKEHIEELANYVRGGDTPYNVYFYNADMNDLNWFVKAIQRADTILMAEGSEVPASHKTWFGPNQEIKRPVDYFINK